MRISNSASDLYNTCSLKYKFKYIDKLKGPQTNTPLLFGVAIDGALNYILESLRDGKVWDKEVAVKIFLDLMDAWDGSNRLEFFKSEAPPELVDIIDHNNKEHQVAVWKNLCERGLKCLDAWIEEILPNIDQVVSVQDKGELLNEEGDQFVFVVDFVAKLKDGRTVLLDNKTSSKRYPKNSVLKSQQLSLYLENFPDLKYAGYCVMIKDPSKERNIRTQLIVDEVPEETKQASFDKIESTLLNIKKEIFEPNNKACYAFGKRCEYWDYCKNNDDSGLISTEREENAQK